MMQMEVDLQSPPLCLLQGYPTSSKRARSPDDSSSPSRPTKRLSLANDNGYPAHYPHYSSQSSSSASSSRHTSEDWVQQASDLTIGSTGAGTPPLNHGENLMVPKEPVKNSCSAPPPAVMSRPHLPPLQTQSIHALPVPKTFSQSVPHIPFPSQNRSTPDKLEYQQPIPPSINILPPTPDVVIPMAFTPVTRIATPMSDSPMSITTSPSSAGISSPSRRRFTMGPRAGCEKCRLGIKGHYMHLD